MFDGVNQRFRILLGQLKPLASQRFQMDAFGDHFCKKLPHFDVGDVHCQNKLCAGLVVLQHVQKLKQSVIFKLALLYSHGFKVSDFEEVFECLAHVSSDRHVCQHESCCSVLIVFNILEKCKKKRIYLLMLAIKCKECSIIAVL